MSSLRDPEPFPESAFIREMRAALSRRVKAGTPAEKAAIGREMLTIMRTHLGRRAWAAAVHVEDEGYGLVPRRIVKRRAHPGRSREAVPGRDGKMLALGPDGE